MATVNMLKLVKIGRVVFVLREWTDRQTYYSSQYFASLPGAK